MRIFRLILLGITVLLVNTCTQDRSTQYHEALVPYVNFLRNKKQDPVDYIVKLFETNDVVILCERAHKEVTQYDFIASLVQDRRFVDKVGHIFTEIGTSTLNTAVTEYLLSENLNENDAEDKLIAIYRNLTIHPVWNNSNFYRFLKELRHINQSLPVNKKLNLYFSDMPVDWTRMTQKKYEHLQKSLPQRDRMMADQIINQFKEVLQSEDKRKKALVIMNFRHAFNDRFEMPGGKKGDNVGRYLFEAFPGKTANVMINSVRIMLGSTDQNAILTTIQDGKWDAVFAVLKNPSVGFNLEPSPFGRDAFDYFPITKEGLTYQDVFTGFVFYKPLKEHRFPTGVPGFYDDGFDKKAIDRYILVGQTEEKATEYVESGKRPMESQLYELAEIEKTILKWIK